MSKYTKVRALGEGSHAKVYLISDMDGREFALKEFLLGQDEEYDEMQSRFLVEKTVLNSIDNQNVIKLLDTVETGLELSIVMELCPHGCLKSQLKNIGPFSLERTLMTGLSILDGLEAIHKAGFIHRDLKPDNILQGEDGVLKIADMGLAKGTDFENKYCQGSVAYMSPEQHTDYNNVDERSDIYSLGATLYHIYTGKELFYGNSIEDILDSHKNCITPSLKDSREDCPLTFNHIVRKMIAKKPADRYQSADSARLDLEAALRGVEGINDLPSIQNVKMLADTLTDQNISVFDFHESGKKKIFAMVALLVVCLGTILFLPEKSATTVALETKVELPVDEMAVEDDSKNIEKELAAAFGQTPVDGVKSLEENIVKDEIDVNEILPQKVTLTDTPVSAAAIPKKNDYLFKGPLLRGFPVKFLGASEDLLSCKLQIKAEVKDCLYGEQYNFIKVLSIQKKYVVVLFKQKAYSLELNQKHLYHGGYYKFTINGKNVVLSKERTFKGFQLVKEGLKKITIADKLGEKVVLSAVEPLESFLKPLSSQKTQEFIGVSSGGVLAFKKFDHKVFPFMLTGVAGEKIQITNEAGKKSVHKRSEIVMSRLQIVKVEDDSAEFRDIRTSKSYLLFKDQKLILQKGAIYSYLNADHRVMDGSSFLGYKVVFEDSKVRFMVDENFDIPFSFTNSRIFLPELNSQR